MCICGIAGGTATDDARVKCAHKGKASLYADFGQVVGGVISNLDDDEKGVITSGTLGGKQITHEVIHAISKTDSCIARHSLPVRRSLTRSLH